MMMMMIYSSRLCRREADGLCRNQSPVDLVTVDVLAQGTHDLLLASEACRDGESQLWRESAEAQKKDI